MTTLISLVLFFIFLFLSGIHFYWAFGGKWGSQSVFPTLTAEEQQKLPGIVPTLIVAIGLLAISIFIISKAGMILLPFPNWITSYGLYLLSAVFFIRAIGEFKYVGFFKKIKETPFGINDTKYYSPLCLFIGGCLLLLQLLIK
jgi:hypothetical protein